MPAVYQVELRDLEQYDPEDVQSRRFNLPLGSTFPIGRSSRNTTKAALLPAENNAFIDSPVISREHAVLSASGGDAAPQISITDVKSMHGTFVNGERLVAGIPKQLSSGDELTFGVDVNRNEEYYIARKYIFEARLMPPPALYSHGFQVPDSDGEEVAGTLPRRGSANQPLTIHDSDSESDMSDNDQAETTMFEQGFVAEDAREGQPTSSLDEAYGQPSSDDDEESLGDYPSGYHDSDLEQDSDGQESNVDELEVDYNSDFDVPEVEDSEAAAEAELEAELEAAIEPVYSQSAPAPAPAPVDLPTLSHNTPQSLPQWAIRESSTSYSSMQSHEHSELPSMSMFKEAVDTSVFNSTFPPPFPPRPSTFRLYNRVQESRPQTMNWSNNEPSTFSDYLGTNHGDRPSLFSPAPASVTSSKEAEPATSLFGSSSIDFPHSNIDSNRLQTPPSMPISDVVSSTPPPGRRTKVSITEIVEEQPPTPPSDNELKRKADVLNSKDMPEAGTHVVVAPGEDVSMADAAVEAAAAQAAAIIAQRPKKQPRSLLKKLGNTAAYFSYGAVGAAGAFALLTCLPDTFFA